MSELENYARTLASNNSLLYHDDDTISTIDSSEEQLTNLKKVLSELTSTDIKCSEIFYQNYNEIYYILVDYMSDLEKYAREVAAECNLKYNDDDSIVAKHEHLEDIELALSKLREAGIPCTEIRMEKYDKVYYILVDF